MFSNGKNIRSGLACIVLVIKNKIFKSIYINVCVISEQFSSFKYLSLCTAAVN
jgi:hypothetical protein